MKKEPLWKYITLRNRPGGVSVSICADDRAAGDARKNILGGHYHGNLWLGAKDKIDIFLALPDPPILVYLLDSVCLPSMATRTRTLYPQASSASNGIHNLFCYFVRLTTEFSYMDELPFTDQNKSIIRLWIWIPWLDPDLQFCSFESFFGQWDWVLGLLLT